MDLFKLSLKESMNRGKQYCVLQFIKRGVCLDSLVLLLIIQSFDWMESFQLYSSNTEPQFITFEVEQRNTSLSGGSQPISYFMIKGKIEVFKLLH